MKTLDEVIDKFEKCDLEVCCENCPYSTEQCVCDPDALYYLKEYKNTDENYKQAMAHVTEVIDYYEKMVADYLSVNNPPLTWDELRTMVGKPVWMQWTVMGVWAYGDWNLIQDADEDRIWFVDKDGETFDEEKEIHGNLWRAYRKEHTDA